MTMITVEICVLLCVGRIAVVRCSSIARFTILFCNEKSVDLGSMSSLLMTWFSN